MGTPKGFVAVNGKMEVNFTVELPVETQRESVCCKDPAVEAAMQAISQHCAIFLWGEDKEAAHVYAEVNELDVEIEEDERT